MAGSETESFAELIEKAQKAPAGAERAVGDAASPFPLPLPAGHRVVTDKDDPVKIPGAVEYDFQAHVKYFNIPNDADKYEDTVNMILSAGAVLRFEEKHFTKEGDFVIVLCYLTKKPKPKKVKGPDLEEEPD